MAEKRIERMNGLNIIIFFNNIIKKIQNKIKI